MDLVVYIVMGVFVVFVAIMSMKQKKRDSAKSLEQRREELWEYSQQRVNEEFRQSKPNDDGSSIEKGSSEEG